MVRRPVALALSGMLLLGCTGPSASEPSIPPGAPRIVASNVTFETGEITVPAASQFALVFENKEAVPHNVTILAGESGTAAAFIGEVFSGPAIRVYQVPALQPGRHQFRCDVHPAMIGTVVAR